MKEVCVLLATYNGERFLAEQLESIMHQSLKPERVLVSDDGSSDRTWDILEQWQQKYPDIISIYKNSTGHHGHVGNFAHLCELAKETDCQYFLFSDQDDVWQNEKIEEQLNRCLQQERSAGASSPILVHSDLAVVGENLEEIAPSFFKYQGLPSALDLDFPKFLIQNNVTGCASLINRTLLELGTPLSKEVMVHDWWFALVAKAEGSIAFIDKPLIKYRQHGGNAIGAVESPSSGLRGKLSQHSRAIKHVIKSCNQAKSLLAYVSKKDTVEPIGWFLSFHKLNALQRSELIDRIANNPKCVYERLGLGLTLYYVSIRQRNERG